MAQRDRDYDELIRPVEERMIRAVWRVLQDADDADEAFQEALATIWTKRDRIWRHANPHALILRICVDAACDAARKRSRQNRGRQPLPAADDVADAAADAALATLERERRVEISAAIGRLPERQAAAVAMRFLLDCPYAEIADAFGCREATVRVHVTRGLDKLRVALAHLDAAKL